jgi:hypothetical protein
MTCECLTTVWSTVGAALSFVLSTWCDNWAIILGFGVGGGAVIGLAEILLSARIPWVDALVGRWGGEADPPGEW